MSDAELIAFLESGARPTLASEEEAARRRSAFAQRFVVAMEPFGDLGVTEEEHELGIARQVFDVHSDLNALGEEEYSAVWSLLSAPNRRAIKAYVDLARRSNE